MISIILIAIAGVLNACMEVVSHKPYLSIFPPSVWWYSLDWKSKYVGGNPENGKRKWLFFNAPSFTYDWWHCAKYFMVVSFAAAIVAYKPLFGGVVDGLVLCMVFATSFLFCYKYALVKRKFWE